MSESFPVLGQALPIELANTYFVRGGSAVEGLATVRQAREWVEVNRESLRVAPRDVDERCRSALLALRGPVRELLAAHVEQRRPDPAALAAVNNAASRGASHVALRWTRSGAKTERRCLRTGADAADRLRADVAEATALFLAGAEAANLRACPAPGCVGFFVQDTPRRTWCSVACGNRARNARFHRQHRTAAAGRASRPLR